MGYLLHGYYNGNFKIICQLIYSLKILNEYYYAPGIVLCSRNTRTNEKDKIIYSWSL